VIACSPAEDACTSTSTRTEKVSYLVSQAYCMTTSALTMKVHRGSSAIIQTQSAFAPSELPLGAWSLNTGWYPVDCSRWPDQLEIQPCVTLERRLRIFELTSTSVSFVLRQPWTAGWWSTNARYLPSQSAARILRELTINDGRPQPRELHFSKPEVLQNLFDSLASQA
jgi:hypothetical protein